MIFDTTGGRKWTDESIRRLLDLRSVPESNHGPSLGVEHKIKF